MKPLALFLFLVLVCSDALAQTGSPAQVENPDEYAVWSAVLRYAYPANASRSIMIHNITGGTSKESVREDVQPHISYYASAIIAEVDRKPCSVERKFKLDLPYVLISRQESATLASEYAPRDLSPDAAATRQAWNDFYKKHSGAYGIVSLSRVAFLNHGTQAAVMVMSKQDAGRWRGTLYLLSREDRSWKVDGAQRFAWA